MFSEDAQLFYSPPTDTVVMAATGRRFVDVDHDDGQGSPSIPAVVIPDDSLCLVSAYTQ